MPRPARPGPGLVISGDGVTIAAGATTIRARSRVVRLRSLWTDLFAAAAIVALACALRLPGLDRYTISFPEGIRAEQLLLMAAGYRPCVEIFCNQGPLLFYALYPTFVMFGQTLEAVRSGVILFSLIGVAATYWLGYLLAGRTAAIVAAMLVALSPTYLKFSRLALAEVPAMAPAVLAVGAALLFYRHGRDRWLVAAGLLLALSLLLKPVTLASCVPVGLFVLMRSSRRWRNVILLTAVTAVALVVPTILIGFSEILEQVVAFRIRSRGVEGRGIDWNWGRIVEELAAERAGVFGFAAAGATVMVYRLRRAALPILIWLPASLLLLLVHTPLHGKHIVTLIPPVALLAGVGAGLALRLAKDRTRDAHPGGVRALWPAGVMAIGLLGYASTLPSILERDRVLMFSPPPLENDPAAYWYDEVVSTLRATTGPREMIVTDHPYLTFAARRLVPPPLVESSVTRIVASSLTPEDAIAEATNYGSTAVLLWADKLTTMHEFKDWVDKSYVPVRVYAADGEATPTLYMRPEQAAGARKTLEALAPKQADLEFEGGVRLVAFGLDDERLAAGDVTAINLTWDVTAKASANYQAIVSLRADDDVAWRSQELPLAGLGPGASSWRPGEVVSMAALIPTPRSIRPGRWSVTVRLYDPKARELVNPPASATLVEQIDPKGVTLGTLTVEAARPR
jgi:hypothetical protein